MKYHRVIIVSLLLSLFLILLPNVLAQTNYTYVAELTLSTARPVYTISERVEVWGVLYLTNYTNGTIVTTSNHVSLIKKN